LPLILPYRVATNGTRIFTMVKLLGSPQFFPMMTVYQDNITSWGGQPGNILQDLNAALWNHQLRKERNYRLNYINSLNAKFMDDTIIVVL
jgi:hypothetical protein